MADKKIRIVASGDWCDGGFGTVMRNIFGRLARTRLFDIHVVGWHYRGDTDLAREAMEAGITLHPTAAFEDGQTQMMMDLTGALTTRKVVNILKPDVLFALGDPWQLDPFVREDFYKAEDAPPPKIVFYTPIDTDIIAQPSLEVLQKADALVLYSQFGMDTLKRQSPGAQPRLILHGVDTSVFREMSKDHVNKMRDGKRWGRQGEPWIVLVVGMNQIRKAHPRNMAAFKAATCMVFNTQEGEASMAVTDPATNETVEFDPPSRWCEEVQLMRCEKCPHYRPDPEKDNWALHFHCVMDAKAGWNLDEMAKRFGIEDRTRCSSLRGHQYGVPVPALAQLMNAADVHLLLTHREGFGLPIVETMACGTPNVVTDYSSCVELLEQGGGYPVKVKDFNTNVFHGAVDANADIADAARGLHRMWADRLYYERQRQKGLAFAKTLDWDGLLPAWIDLFREMAAHRAQEAEAMAALEAEAKSAQEASV